MSSRAANCRLRGEPACRCVLFLIACAPLTGTAGEIPGLPTQLPPFQERVLELAFSNDFLGRAVLSVDTGLRIAAADLGARGSIRIQLELRGRLPISDATLDIGTETFQIQRPALDILLGMTIDFK